MADERTFTEKEHFALLTDAVTREVAKATEEADERITELTSRIDVLEAEKAAEVEKREAVEREFADFKAELEKAAEVEGRKSERIEAVKAVATLPESYFTTERAQRWAEMPDEQFTALLDDFAEATATSLGAEAVKEVAALDGDAKRNAVAQLVAKAREAGESDGGVTTVITKETAAFTGGKSPSDPESGPSTLRSFLTRTAS